MPRTTPTIAVLLLAGSLVIGAPPARAVELPVGDSVQEAIEAAAPGAVIELAEGVYEGDLDFGGKAITIRGAGPRTVLRGSGGGPVVRFESGEGTDSVLDSVTVTGGLAERGGGVFIDGASPCVVRCVVRRNRAHSQGSGIYVGGASNALIFNNLVTHNRRSGGGDPHGIEIVGSAPAVVNNTVARTDSNGIVLRGASAAAIANNILAWNGSRVRGRRRGRGICDFSDGRARIVNNVFHRNLIAALLRDARDWRRIRRFQRTQEDTLVTGNVDGSPGFRRNPPRRAARSRPHHFDLRRRGRAIDAGVDDADCRDSDDTRNDAGHTGGPFANGSTDVPTPASCTPALR